MYYVYLLHLVDGSVDAGFFEDLTERLRTHRKGGVRQTKRKVAGKNGVLCGF